MSTESGTSDPGPSCSPVHLPPDKEMTIESRTSVSEPSEGERKPSESESPSREEANESDQMMEKTRKRKHSSEDSPGTTVGNESPTNLKKRQKTPAKKRELKVNGHQGGLACCPEAQHTSPPPLRKKLVTFLRAMSEAIYADVVQLQAQQHHCLLTQEQLSKLTELSGSLTAMVQTFYSMSSQAAYAFPAEGWLVPAPLSVPQELCGSESQSSSLEGGELTDPASPASSPEPKP